MQDMIALDNFSNRIALKIGMTILEVAEEKQLSVAVDIRRLNQQVFCYLSDGLSEDKNHWLVRKANTARRFMTSSLSVANKLAGDNSTLSSKYGLSDEEYVAVGGAIPIMVDGVGMVGTIAVTGLQPEEDHQLIHDAVKRLYSCRFSQ